MSYSDHSTLSYEKQGLIHAPTGSHKVRYLEDEDWDFYLDTSKPVDLSLVLPHYRARNQPVDHHLSMFLANSESQPMKLKVCRSYCRAKFQMQVRAASSDVTIWLPSDFRGAIHCPRTASFSAGFINRIMENIRLNEPTARKEHVTPADEDEVIVYTSGHVSFRMWDVQTCTSENPHKETFKRLFCCARKAPETSAHDWDFLLEN